MVLENSLNSLSSDEIAQRWADRRNAYARAHASIAIGHVFFECIRHGMTLGEMSENETRAVFDSLRTSAHVSHGA